MFNSLFRRVGHRNSPGAYLHLLRLSAHADPVRSARNESAETGGANKTANGFLTFILCSIMLAPSSHSLFSPKLTVLDARPSNLFFSCSRHKVNGVYDRLLVRRRVRPREKLDLNLYRLWSFET